MSSSVPSHRSPGGVRGAGWATMVTTIFAWPAAGLGVPRAAMTRHEPDAEPEREWRSGFDVKSTVLAAIPAGLAWFTLLLPAFKRSAPFEEDRLQATGSPYAGHGQAIIAALRTHGVRHDARRFCGAWVPDLTGWKRRKNRDFTSVLDSSGAGFCRNNRGRVIRPPLLPRYIPCLYPLMSHQGWC